MGPDTNPAAQMPGNTPQTTPAPANGYTANQIEKPPKKKKWLIISGLLVGLIVVWQVTAQLLGGSGSSGQGILYDALQNAAQKNVVHIAQHRVTYGSEADLTGNKPETQTKSVTELDVKSGAYSTVYLIVGTQGGVEVERCVKDQEYRPANRFPKTLAEGEAAANGPSTLYEYKAGQSDTYGPCNWQRSGHSGKFSDGILPVGLTAEQATSWINYYKMREPLTLKDEGKATVGKYSGRKVSFEVGKEATGKPYKSDLFFYAYRDGDTGKTFGLGIPLEEISYQFERLLEGSSPSGVKGFYLIDEATKLPVYSEFTTVADGASDFKPYSGKQAYQYPAAATMDEKTKLEAL